MIKNKIFKLLSILLTYPDINLKKDIDLVLNLIVDDKNLSDKNIEFLSSFITYIKINNLTSLQENYVSIFDRQKKFSLYLFEHIHGDSRERGSAMIDLQALYKNYSFEISECKELPDYLPLFLEFISLIPQEDANTMLGEIINLISVIKKRLEIIENPYALVFEALESFSSIKPDHKIIEKTINNDRKLELESNIDKEWEEEKVF